MVWLDVRHANWAVIFLLLAIGFLYYGIKFSRILTINIVIAETSLGLSPTGFGFRNFFSWSPARYIFIMQQTIIFSSSCMAIAATLLLSSFIILRGNILTTQLVPHFYAFAWTWGAPALFAAKLFLMHVQLIRNRAMQELFKRLHKAICGRVNSYDLRTEPDPEHRLMRYEPCFGGELDPERNAAGTEVENATAHGTHSTEEQVTSPETSDCTLSNTTPPSVEETGATWEYPQYFLSDNVAALPASSYVPVTVLPHSQQDAV